MKKYFLESAAALTVVFGLSGGVNVAKADSGNLSDYLNDVKDSGALDTQNTDIQPTGSVAEAKVENLTTSFLQVGQLTYSPYGHSALCKRWPHLCQTKNTQELVIVMTDEILLILKEINSFVNATITPMTDKETYGLDEFWDIFDWKVLNSNLFKGGDCEDFSLTKAKMLMEKHGFPEEALSVVVVLQENGEGHAVLAVRTDQGDYILDNLTDEILFMHQTSYAPEKMQTSLYSQDWKMISVQEGERQLMPTMQ